MDDANLIKNYLNLMVNAGDQSRNKLEDDLVVYDLSHYYQKMLSEDDSFENDVPFASMIYEAAIITLNNFETTEYVTVSVTQFGFSDLETNFLPNPKSPEILNSNSENVARMIVQMCYAFWQMNEKGFIYTDLIEENVLVNGNPDDFSPLIINFEKLINLNELKLDSLALKEEMMNISDSDYSENLKYVKELYYLVRNEEIAFKFEFTSIDPETFFTREWKEKISTSYDMGLLVNFKYNMAIREIVHFFEIILKNYIDKKLIDGDHKNIKKLKEQIDLFEKKIFEEHVLLTNDEVFEKLNEASGLNLTEFNYKNDDLDNYFREIKSKNDSQDASKMEKLDGRNDERIILV
jgi:hypothetical protein